MPGTRAGRSRQNRAWTRSLELIGQSSTPADCWRSQGSREHARTGDVTECLSSVHDECDVRNELLNPCAHLIEPLPCFEIRKEVGQVTSHSLAVPIHHR